MLKTCFLSFKQFVLPPHAHPRHPLIPFLLPYPAAVVISCLCLSFFLNGMSDGVDSPLNLIDEEMASEDSNKDASRGLTFRWRIHTESGRQLTEKFPNWLDRNPVTLYSSPDSDYSLRNSLTETEQRRRSLAIVRSLLPLSCSSLNLFRLPRRHMVYPKVPLFLPMHQESFCSFPQPLRSRRLLSFSRNVGNVFLFFVWETEAGWEEEINTTSPGER